MIEIEDSLLEKLTTDLNEVLVGEVLEEIVK
jgi:hypothetical protein